MRELEQNTVLEKDVMCHLQRVMIGMRETQNEFVKDRNSDSLKVREPQKLSISLVQILFSQSDRNKSLIRSQTNVSTLPITLMHPQ